MIKTTLVIGAGASVPYGFPTGAALIRNIVTRAKSVSAESPLSQQYRDLAAALEASGCNSIDAFLQYRTEYIPVGKLLIALEIYESESRSDVNLFESSKTDWIRILFNQILENPNTIKIVSFNYDRVFQHKLLTMCEARKFASDKTTDILRRSEVVHAHGRLMHLPMEKVFLNLPEQRRSFYDGYGLFFQSADATKIEYLDQRKNDIVNGFKIIGESIQNIEATQDAIAWAERVIFLGFGFHRENLNSLGIMARGGASKILVGTALGMTKNAWDDVERTLPGIKLFNTDCASLLNDHIKL